MLGSGEKSSCCEQEKVCVDFTDKQLDFFSGWMYGSSVIVIMIIKNVGIQNRRIE